MSAPSFRVVLTGDFHESDGQPRYRDLGLAELRRSRSQRCRALEEHRPVLGADQLAGCTGGHRADAPGHGGDRLGRRRPAGDRPVRRRLRRGGRGGLHRRRRRRASSRRARSIGSVAEATVGWMIALTHHVRVKDRAGPRRADGTSGRGTWAASCATGRFGAIGLGGIGRATVGPAPRVRHEAAAGVRPVPRPRAAARGRRAARRARRAAGRGRFRLDPLPAHRPDARPDRRPRARR